MKRRKFLHVAGATAVAAGMTSELQAKTTPKRPNILYLFSDQWRASDHGYAGNREVHTPNLDKLAGESLNFTHAVSGIPVCCPHRASLLTGQRPLSHGLYLNDLALTTEHRSVAHCLNDAGYSTGYIGKWHIDGRGRSAFTPEDRRQGFQFWRGLECTHNYKKSFYYGETPERIPWEGYEPFPQTRMAQEYLEDRAKEQDADPFAMFVSWGPPHAPYQTAPEKHRKMYAGLTLTLRDNVPAEQAVQAEKDYLGYYAHMTALDECVGDLMKTLEATGLAENTIVVYTSDHGDMLHSHGFMKKQQPWDESLRVPFLVRWPAGMGRKKRETAARIDTPDIMPTLLGLCGEGERIPDAVEGRDLSGVIRGSERPDLDYAPIMTCPAPFGQWSRARGGREYRGVRTCRWTYCKDLKGPWLLYDNEADPFQKRNLAGVSAHAKKQRELEDLLRSRLQETGDEFLPGDEYIRRSGYVISERSGTVDYHKPFDERNYTKSPL
ncbi:MAG: arylsulfatase A-like enzyme [Limisphaerales bacterium]|jgi:arylsulfatase A-like enzyme